MTRSSNIGSCSDINAPIAPTTSVGEDITHIKAYASDDFSAIKIRIRISMALINIEEDRQAGMDRLHLFDRKEFFLLLLLLLLLL